MSPTEGYNSVFFVDLDVVERGVSVSSYERNSEKEMSRIVLQRLLIKISQRLHRTCLYAPSKAK